MVTKLENPFSIMAQQGLTKKMYKQCNEVYNRAVKVPLERYCEPIQDVTLLQQSTIVKPNPP